MAAIGLMAWLLAGMLSASSAAPAHPMRDTRPTQCTHDALHDTPFEKTLNAAQHKQVPLLLGVEAGMSRLEVEEIDPHLLRETRPFEMFGTKLRAYASFFGVPEVVVGLYMDGHSHYNEVVSALTDQYGRPLTLAAYSSDISAPIFGRENTETIEYETLEWCDGEREFVLEGETHNFTLSIRPAPL
jgi:hypothetical protein